MHSTGVGMVTKTQRPLTYGRMTNFLRQAELGSGTGATGATVVKQSHSPLMQLMFESAQWERGVKGAKKPVDGEKFGSHELEASQEIEAAFFAISGGMMFKPMNYERTDPGKPSDWPEALALKVRRYQAWACHWSMMAKRFDPTLQIVIAAVIDQRPFRETASDLGFGHERIRNATVRGLRDYAARAGWAHGRDGDRWRLNAGMTFRRAAVA